ncbi:anosmin-1b isoform X2 [Danio rerio]|uniref:Anosmin-1b isoform X2 n=1 Tax=Danio rerio TaxID=7955 RepID=A0AC58IDT1_DANRE
MHRLDPHAFTRTSAKMLLLRNLCCFLLCCVFEVSVARRTEEAESLEKMESARCVSRCLTLHITQITAAFRHLQNDRVLGWCENHRRCSQCLQPCKELWETRRALSPKTCEHHECVTSAEFLRSLRVQKQGDCPPAQRASGFAAACVESCARDHECSGVKKCCSNGCGHTCQSPANLFKDPLPPETPQNARTANQTLHPDGTVSVLVLWETPRESDLVLHHYKVTWSPRGTPSSSQSRAGRVTDGDVTQMELQGLQPNTPYTAQIQAISYWGQNRLKSSRAHVSFTTTSQNSAKSQKDSSSYILRWYPEVCSHNVTKDEKTATVQGTHYVITGLLFACKYRVAVKPVAEQRSEVTTSVTTPLCLSLMGRRKKPAACAREERHPQLKKALRRPEKLAVLFQPVNGSLQALFSWQLSPESSGQTPSSGFQFSWVKVSSGSSNGSLISQTHVLPPDQLSLTVDALQPSSVYRVQVQVLSEAGNGPSVAKTLHTPALNSTIH